MADDFFLPCHQSKYICLSALLTVIREERGRGGDREGKIKIRDTDGDSGAAVQPGGKSRDGNKFHFLPRDSR